MLKSYSIYCQKNRFLIYPGCSQISIAHFRASFFHEMARLPLTLLQKKIGTGLKAQLPTFNDFLNNFFEEAFGLVSVRREWCLGLYTAGELMTDCDEIVRFRKIVDNEVSLPYAASLVMPLRFC